jgi:hypothetical protein
MRAATMEGSLTKPAGLPTGQPLAVISIILSLFILSVGDKLLIQSAAKCLFL